VGQKCPSFNCLHYDALPPSARNAAIRNDTGARVNCAKRQDKPDSVCEGMAWDPDNIVRCRIGKDADAGVCDPDGYVSCSWLLPGAATADAAAAGYC